MEFLQRLVLPGWDGLLEIIILAVAFYYVLAFLHGTRGVQVLFGLAMLFIVLVLLTYFFQLDTLNWILQRATVYLVFALLVIFQPEIRRALAELGRRHFFGGPVFEHSTIERLVEAASRLSEQKIGGLIAVERDVGTRAIRETGVAIDAELSPELLINLFYPRTPLHDGGVIVQNNRVVAAACVFPLSQRDEVSRTLGTRHRAAMGITDETDAIAVVVSEETGSISVAYRGKLRRGLDEDRLQRVLTSVLMQDRPKKKKKTWRERLRLVRGGRGASSTTAVGDRGPASVTLAGDR